MNMKSCNKLFRTLIVLAFPLMFAACSGNDDEAIPMSRVTVGYTLPDNYRSAKATDMKVTFHNLGRGESATFDLNGDTTVTLERNLYNVEVNGRVSYVINGKEVEARLRGRQENVAIGDEATTISVRTNAVSAKDGFVFAEIFVSGTRTPAGDVYYSDKYFRIYNNSADTLYADGLVLFESAFQNDDPQQYTPDIRDSALTIANAYMIPGTGHDHPVAPGKSILLVDVGEDHTRKNANSFDLSKADFEWYDYTDDGEDVDTDVPNLVKLITTDDYGTVGLWAPHTRGVKTYAIGYLGDGDTPMTADEYLRDYLYTYKWTYAYGSYTFDMDGKGYMLPNTWIADCVNLRPLHCEQAWLCASGSLDAGFAYNSSQENDESRYGKAVRRKYDKATGRLVDTNNSTNDFESMVEANPYYEFK